MIKFGSWAGKVGDGACLIGQSYVWDLYVTQVVMKMTLRPALLLTEEEEEAAVVVVVASSWLRRGQEVKLQLQDRAGLRLPRLPLSSNAISYRHN